MMGTPIMSRTFWDAQTWELVPSVLGAGQFALGCPRKFGLSSPTTVHLGVLEGIGREFRGFVTPWLTKRGRQARTLRSLAPSADWWFPAGAHPDMTTSGITIEAATARQPAQNIASMVIPTSFQNDFWATSADWRSPTASVLRNLPIRWP